MRLWTLANTLLTLACVGCCAYLFWQDRTRPAPVPEAKPPEPESRAVSEVAAVRSFLGLNSLGGVVDLPADVKHWAVVVMKFEDGQYKGRLTAAEWSPSDGGPAKMPFSLVWGPGPAGQGVFVADVIGGRSGFARKDAFMGTFDQVDERNPAGVVTSFSASVSTHSSTLLGYHVFAEASSARVRQGGAQEKWGALNFEIENRKQVIACGVKPFATRDEASEWISRGKDVP